MNARTPTFTHYSEVREGFRSICGTLSGTAAREQQWRPVDDSGPPPGRVEVPTGDHRRLDQIVPAEDS
jgi:hypothetical protein